MPTELGSDLRGALLLGGLFLLLLGLAEIWTRLLNPKAEWSRKLVHAAGGLICLLLPYWVQQVTSVLVLAAALYLFFLMGLRRGWLLSVSRVDRQSRGIEYYPLAVFLVFWLSAGVIWIYLASILVLACADSAAALVGSRYGRRHYTVDRETKSLEGSLAFGLIAFAGCYLPVAGLSDLSRPAAVLSSILVALVVTAIEAVSRNGRDNLFVPVAVCLILAKISSKELLEIIYQLSSLLLCFSLLGLVVWRSRSMNVGGALVGILFCYAAWSLGSELWLVPLLGSLALFLGSWPSGLGTAATAGLPEKHSLRVPALTRALTAPFLILLTANFSGSYSLLLAPFVAAIIYFSNFFLWRNLRRRLLVLSEITLSRALLYGGANWLLVAGPTWYLQSTAATGLLWVLLLLSLGCAAVSCLYYRASPSAGASLSEPGLLSLLLPTLVAAALVWALQWAGLSRWEHWQLF